MITWSSVLYSSQIILLFMLTTMLHTSVPLFVCLVSFEEEDKPADHEPVGTLHSEVWINFFILLRLFWFSNHLNYPFHCLSKWLLNNHDEGDVWEGRQTNQPQTSKKALLWLLKNCLLFRIPPTPTPPNFIKFTYVSLFQSFSLSWRDINLR